MHRRRVDSTCKRVNVSANEHNLKNCKTHRNRNFDVDETILLINLWGDPKLQDSLIRSNKKVLIFEMISERMKLYGFDRSTTEVRCKINNIKSLYFKLKRELAMNQRQTIDWIHFDAMDKVLKLSIFKTNLQPTFEDVGAICQDEELNNDKEVFECQIKDEPVEDDNLVHQFKEEPIDIIDYGIDENIEKVVEVYEVPQKKQKMNSIDELIQTIKPSEKKLVGTKCLITIPTKPTNIQLNENLSSIASTSSAKDKMTTNISDNTTAQFRVPLSPQISLAACSSKSNVTSTELASTSSPKLYTMPIKELNYSVNTNANKSNEFIASVASTSTAKEKVTIDLTDNTMKIVQIKTLLNPQTSPVACSSKSNDTSTVTASTSSQSVISTNKRIYPPSLEVQKARASLNLKLQNERSQKNITILQQNHKKIGKNNFKVPQLLNKPSSPSSPSSSTPINITQPVPGKSVLEDPEQLSLNNPIVENIFKFEEKRLHIECQRLAIEQQRLKIEVERFNYSKNTQNEVLSLLKSVLLNKKLCSTEGEPQNDK